MASPLQNPPIGEPESAMLPGMAAAAPAQLLSPTQNTTGGFPNIPDSSVPGLQALQEPPSWFYDFDPGTGTARATFQGEVTFTSGGSATAGVTTFNTRTGAVTLTAADVTGVGGIVNPSAALSGVPTAPTAAPGVSTTQIATTAFVGQAIAAGAGVLTFNGRSGAVTLSLSDVVSAGGAPVASPSFTGNPQAPTPVVGDSSSAVATTQFVNNWAAQNAVLSFNGRRGAVTLSLSDITSAGGAPLASPNFSGTPSGPTAAPGTSTQQLASTAFVENAVQAASSGVVSFNGRSGVVTLSTADVTGAGGAPLLSPNFGGTPTAATATAGTNTTQLATTAFVATAIGSMAPVVTGFNGRTGAVTLQLTDVTSAGGAPLAAPVFTGSAASPTPTAGDSSTRIATTAFVGNALSALPAYLPLTGGTLSNVLNFSGGAGIQYSGVANHIALGWDSTHILGNVDGTGIPGALMNATGVTDGSNAPNGQIGQYTSQVSTSPVGIGSNIVGAVASVTLGAGDWDISGIATFNGASTTTVNYVQAAISTSATAITPVAGQPGYMIHSGGGQTLYAFAPLSLSIPPTRESISATTTFYLAIASGFGAGTTNVVGSITARRVR
jgi:hypothetical protein